MDPWDFADPVDILSKLPTDFEEIVASKKWSDRKEALETVLKLATDNIRLDPKGSYHILVDILARVRLLMFFLA